MTPEQVTALLLTIADLRLTVETLRARILELEAERANTPAPADGVVKTATKAAR